MHQFLYLVLGCWMGFIVGLFCCGIMRADWFLNASRKTADLHQESGTTRGWNTRVN